MASPSTARRRSQPWTRLYQLAAWRKCMRNVHARDGGRCTEVVDGRRCPVTLRLHGHHTMKVRQLFLRSASWDEFVRAACDPNIVRLVCATHNNKADARLRRVEGGRVQGGRGASDPPWVSSNARPLSKNRFSTAVTRHA